MQRFKAKDRCFCFYTFPSGLRFTPTSIKPSFSHLPTVKVISDLVQNERQGSGLLFPSGR